MDSIDRAEATALHEVLWRQHAEELVRFGSLLVGPTDAHDIVSAAFLRVSRLLASRHIDQPRAYLFRAVANEAHDLRRINRNRWERDRRAAAAIKTTSVDSQFDVRQAVADLSVRQRSVIYLAYWEDMTERQIAEFLQLSHGSVQRHLSRARAHLRKALHD